MGISKAKGMAIAKRMSGHGGNVYVLTGDGELQEGQIYESLQTASHHAVNNLIAIIDHNKVQSDKRVDEITNLGKLEEKLALFGWHVERCDGHDFKQLDAVMGEFQKITDRPKVLIADTIKGKGISFMEHPQALKDGKGLYHWHSGAPDDKSFQNGFNELIDRINVALRAQNFNDIILEPVPPIDKPGSCVSNEYVVVAYGEALLDIVKKNKKVVVLDADLAADCRIRKCEDAYPNQFIECGIAEQDMVSTAGGLAIQGYIPIVNSFAAFLASRANEQIYTNACENTKIIYTFHYAGLIPAGPGKSHQSIRDISLLGALPNLEIIQPCNAVETKMALNYCVYEAENSCMLRLIIGPSPLIVDLPSGYRLKKGRGLVIREGKDGVLFTYGPVMIHEAIKSHELLLDEGYTLKIVNMPWLNRVDVDWLRQCVKDINSVYVLEDHAANGGLGDFLLRKMVKESILMQKSFEIMAVEEMPAWGNPAEVLKHHGVDHESLKKKILKTIAKCSFPSNK